jgi:hypothetical protein
MPRQNTTNSNHATQTGRISKPSAPRKKHVPAWYERITKPFEYRKEHGADPGPLPEDFDEDLSELEENGDPDENQTKDKEHEEYEDARYPAIKQQREERKQQWVNMHKTQEVRAAYYEAREEEVGKVFSKTSGYPDQPLDLVSAKYDLYSSELVRSWDPKVAGVMKSASLSSTSQGQATTR